VLPVSTSADLIGCESRIERVVVYARGAVVTRRVTLPEALPEGPVALRVAGVTALAETGSVRAILTGDREVTALEARVVVPAAPAAPGALLEQVRALELERQRLEAEQASVTEQRAALADVALDPALRRWARHLDPAARFADALAASALVGAEVERLDARLRALGEALRDNRRAREAAAIAAAQGSPQDLAGRAQPQLEVRVRLGAGGAAPGSLAVEYVVRAARWWPAYTARFTAAATKVSLSIDAFVAQASGEDWSGIKLSLSTADLAQDARLPQLPSLRFGRAQPPPRRGYRPAPVGLDAMFEGYDRVALPLRPPPPPPQQESVTRDGSAMSTHDELIPQTRATRRGGPPLGGMPYAAPPPGGFGAPPPSSSGALNEAALGPPAPSFAPPARKGFARTQMAAAPSDAIESGGGGGHQDEPELPAAIEPADAWLDFDTLVLHDARNRTERGHLRRDAGAVAGKGAGVEGLSSPPFASDPQTARGRFDHRYDAEGTADVPGAGRALRIAVTSADASATPRFTAVPREVAEVFREAEIQNPFAAPLLSGPVDVFLDGALLTVSQIAFVDRSGWIRLGLGVEERLRVARNARVDEGTVGLLGGSAVIDHAVTIDLASSLGRKVTVEILERVPVSDEKDVEIKLTYARPEHETYTQADRGAPLRRGLRFKIDVPAGDKARVELGYRVTLPSKNEIVGGNRRE
jgi:Domain of unknown function (DUF4139)/N-terminal domain of unknown function (DUF4140)